MKKLYTQLLSGFALIALGTTNAVSASFEHNLTDQVIVQFNENNANGALKARGLSAQINKKLSFVRKTSLGAYVYRLPSMEELPQVKGYITALSAVSGVKHAEADQMMFAIGDLAIPPAEGVTSSSQSPIYGLQWHYFESIGGMNVEGGWGQFNSTDPVVNVAVLDTGITAHPDLLGNVVGGTDMISTTFVSNDGDGRDSDPSDPGDWIEQNYCGGGVPAADSSWHGTHVSGTIAAVTNNSSGVAGVGYNLLKVVPVRVLGKCGGYTSDIADGIVWAAVGSDNPNKAKVINMSLGGGGACSSTYQQAINTAVAAGTTVVVSAGNSSADAANYSPASCDNVISVASTGRTGGKAYYSNYGSVVDFAAPGGDMSTGGSNGVLSTLNDGTTTPNASIYAYYQGTSMAAPHVAAAAGLLYVKKPNVTPAEVEDVLSSSARPFPSGCNQCGTGILDLGAAISALDGSTPPPPPEMVPAVPGNFVITPGIEIADLSWSDQSVNEQAFYIERRKKNRRKWTGWSSVVTTAADVTIYQDSGLDGTYQYRIRSQNNAGISAWVVSGEVQVSSGSGGGGGGCKGNGKKCR
jgi:serine protease